MGMRHRRRKRKEPAGYATKVMSAGRHLAPGRAYVVDVEHDSGCRLLKKAGACNCTPRVGKPLPVPSAEDN